MNKLFWKMIQTAGVEKQAEGTLPLNVDNAEIGSYYDFKIYGNGIQNGVPSATNPEDLNGCGDLVTDTQNPNNGKYRVNVNSTAQNLLNVNNYQTSITINGVTFTVFPNGDVRATGTPIAVCWFNLLEKNTPLLLNGTYFFSGCPYGGSNTTYKLQIETALGTLYVVDIGNGISFTANNVSCQGIYIGIYPESGTVNLLFKPRLVLGIDSFEETKLPSMISYPYAVGNQTINGVTFTFNTDNSISVVGTPTDTIWLNLLLPNAFKLNGKYFLQLKGGQNIQSIALQVDKAVGAGERVAIDYGSGTDFETANTDILGVFIRIYTTAGAINSTFTPILSEYDKTFGTNYNYYLDTQLYKVGVYEDYIDNAYGKLYKNVTRRVLTGTEFITIGSQPPLSGTAFLFQNFFTQNGSTVICNYYKTIDTTFSYAAMNIGDIKALTINNVLYICDNFTTLTDFTNMLKARYASGNPVIVYYNRPSANIVDIGQEQALELSSPNNIIDSNNTIKPSNFEITYTGE